MPTTKQIQTIVDLSAQGIPLRDMAEQVGLAAPTICQARQKPEVKAMIDAIHNDLLSTCLEQSKANISNLIHQYPTRLLAPANLDEKGKSNGTVTYAGQVIPESSHKLAIDHGFRASQKLLESTGILASQSPSILVQQMFAQVNVQVIPEALNDVFRAYLGQIQPVIDVLPSDSE